MGSDQRTGEPLRVGDELIVCATGKTAFVKQLGYPTPRVQIEHYDSRRVEWVDLDAVELATVAAVQKWARRDARAKQRESEPVDLTDRLPRCKGCGRPSPSLVAGHCSVCSFGAGSVSELEQRESEPQEANHGTHGNEATGGSADRSGDARKQGLEGGSSGGGLRPGVVRERGGERGRRGEHDREAAGDASHAEGRPTRGDAEGVEQRGSEPPIEDVEKTLRGILYYVEAWEDGDDARHALGHVRTLVDAIEQRGQKPLFGVIDAIRVVRREISYWAEPGRLTDDERNAVVPVLRALVEELRREEQRCAEPQGGNDASRSRLAEQAGSDRAGDGRVVLDVRGDVGKPHGGDARAHGATAARGEVGNDAGALDVSAVSSGPAADPRGPQVEQRGERPLRVGDLVLVDSGSRYGEDRFYVGRVRLAFDTHLLGGHVDVCSVDPRHPGRGTGGSIAHFRRLLLDEGAASESASDAARRVVASWLKRVPFVMTDDERGHLEDSIAAELWGLRPMTLQDLLDAPEDRERMRRELAEREQRSAAPLRGYDDGFAAGRVAGLEEAIRECNEEAKYAAPSRAIGANDCGNRITLLCSAAKKRAEQRSAGPSIKGDGK